VKVSMPCITCGVTNLLTVEETGSMIFVCPSCHMGTAYIDGSIYPFRKELLESKALRGRLVLNGAVRGTDRADRFSALSISSTGGEGFPQKGETVTDSYVRDLGSSLEGVSSLEDILERMERPKKPS